MRELKSEMMVKINSQKYNSFVVTCENRAT